MNYVDFEKGHFILFYFILWLLYIVIPYHAFIVFLFEDCFKLHGNT